VAVDPVAEHIRQRSAAIVDRWEHVVREQLPTIAHMTRPVLLDHLPELLEGLAAWIEGDTATAERGFEALTRGHAVQRLGFGIGIETLTHEYMHLRTILLQELLRVPVSPGLRESMMRMHAGLDRAMARALEYYGQRRDQIRDRFVSILGHDLRGPLSSIAMAASMMAKSPTVDHEAMARRIATACERMARMVDDVLDFARGHLGGGIPANPTLGDLGEICRAAVEEVRQARPDRRVHLDVRGELRGPLDRDRAQQAVANLLANAIQHGQGDIHVRAFETEDRQHICCAVTSRGKTIPPELVQRLFDPFAHAVDPARPRTGLGLGLYIVDQIALAHGGMVDVVSEDGETTFTIRLPRIPGEHRRALAVAANNT
jgi:signal transduction histidine kinase